MRIFQSARPCGARQSPFACIAAIMDISIRAPVWGATKVDGNVLLLPVISLRAPGWGATHTSLSTHRMRKISIRAPVWGATINERLDELVKDKISIRAPVWGATIFIGKEDLQVRNFNPRARVGRDWLLLLRSLCRLGFQSARPCGARLDMVKTIAMNFHFNPRARVGRDQPTLRLILNPSYFNPRARVGRDIHRW